MRKGWQRLFRWLTQKENYLGAKMLCLLKDSACLNLTVQSCHMWDHGCIKAPRPHSTASSLNASISCTLSLNGYTCWYRPKSSDNTEIAYFHSFTIFTCLKRQLLATPQGRVLYIWTTYANGQRQAMLSSTAFSAMSRSKPQAATLCQSAYLCVSLPWRSRADLFITDINKRYILSRWHNTGSRFN